MSAISEPLKPKWGDMQGLVLTAFPHLDQAAYLLFEIVDPDSTKRWLARHLPAVASAFKGGRYLARRATLNIAFTSSGLERLGGPIADFSDAFIDGIHGPLAGDERCAPVHRSRVLGDVGTSDPRAWRWGGPSNPVDVLLMVFVDKDVSLNSTLDQLGVPPDVMREVARVTANPLGEMDGREHFGFKDGISQPILEGSTDAERFPESIHLTALGEFVLGYPNADGQALGARDPVSERVLPLPSLRGCPRFGENGSYLVLRQLAQDVERFWETVIDCSGADSPDDPVAELLAAKLVGRWPNGTPLVPYANVYDNEFTFAEDAFGYACPLGAHVRRANPRDALENTSRPFSTRNNRRLLRRGRAYAAPRGSPQEMGERGLMFLCLNADLERQYEFIQHNWINNSAFAGLAGERDPLIGAGAGKHGAFTIAGRPAPRRVHDLPRFVDVRGGQ